MKKILFSTIILLSGVMLASGFIGNVGCSMKSNNSFNTIETDSLRYHHWVLKKLNGIEIVKEKAGNEIPSIKFLMKENQLSGNTGCNDVYGKAFISGNEVTFSEMSMTKMFCSEAEYEMGFVNILFCKKPLKFKIENKNLTIFQENKAVMIFEKKD